MPIINHVTSLELSRRLKELGVKQESYFWWRQDNMLCNILQKKNYHPDFVLYSSYLASELGELIGDALDKGKDINIPKELQLNTIQSLWKPDYLAKLLIWLIENHLISAEELNK